MAPAKREPGRDAFVDRAAGRLLERGHRLVRRRTFVEEARAVEADRVRGDDERADRDVLARAAGGADPQHGQRPGGSGTVGRTPEAGGDVEREECPGLDERDLDVVGADAGSQDGDREAPVRARQRHELAVLHLVLHAVEAGRHRVGPRRIADDEQVSGELGRAQPQVIDAAVHDDDLRGPRSGGRGHGPEYPLNTESQGGSAPSTESGRQSGNRAAVVNSNRVAKLASCQAF